MKLQRSPSRRPSVEPCSTIVELLMPYRQPSCLYAPELEWADGCYRKSGLPRLGGMKQRHRHLFNLRPHIQLLKPLRGYSRLAIERAG